MESEEHVDLHACAHVDLPCSLERSRMAQKRELKRIKKNSSKLLLESALHTCIKIYFIYLLLPYPAASTTCTGNGKQSSFVLQGRGRCPLFLPFSYLSLSRNQKLTPRMPKDEAPTRRAGSSSKRAANSQSEQAAGSKTMTDLMSAHRSD